MKDIDNITIPIKIVSDADRPVAHAVVIDLALCDEIGGDNSVRLSVLLISCFDINALKSGQKHENHSSKTPM